MVVSEETAQISIALEGKLTRNYNRVTLREVLERTLVGTPNEASTGKGILDKPGLSDRAVRKGD